MIWHNLTNFDWIASFFLANSEFLEIKPETLFDNSKFLPCNWFCKERNKLNWFFFHFWKIQFTILTILESSSTSLSFKAVFFLDKSDTVLSKLPYFFFNPLWNVQKFQLHLLKKNVKISNIYHFWDKYIIFLFKFNIFVSSKLLQMIYFLYQIILKW